MQQINKITQPFPEILSVCYFGKPWTCHGMPDQILLILQDLSNYLQKEQHYTSNIFRDFKV